MNLAFRMLLSTNGVSDADQAQIENALPAMERLLDAEQKLQAIAKKAQPLQNHIDQMQPILKSRVADSDVSMPVIEMLIKFIKGAQS